MIHITQDEYLELTAARDKLREMGYECLRHEDIGQQEVSFIWRAPASETSRSQLLEKIAAHVPDETLRVMDMWPACQIKDENRNLVQHGPLLNLFRHLGHLERRLEVVEAPANNYRELLGSLVDQIIKCKPTDDLGHPFYQNEAYIAACKSLGLWNEDDTPWQWFDTGPQVAYFMLHQIGLTFEEHGDWVTKKHVSTEYAVAGYMVRGHYASIKLHTLGYTWDQDEARWVDPAPAVHKPDTPVYSVHTPFPQDDHGVYMPLNAQENKPQMGDTVYVLKGGTTNEFDEVRFVGMEPPRVPPALNTVGVYSASDGTHMVAFERTFVRKPLEHATMTLRVTPKGSVTLIEDGTPTPNWPTRYIHRARAVGGKVEVMWSDDTPGAEVVIK